MERVVLDEDFEEYLVLCKQEDRVKGYRRKEFVRCSSKLFAEYIDELRKNPNCSYISYMNDIIKSGYTPEKFSIIKKECRENPFKEAIASRIMNYFECPTVYDDMIVKDGEFYSCSIDFGICGEDFYTFDEICKDFDRFEDLLLYDSMETVVNKLRNALENYIPQFLKIDKDPTEMINKYLENFVYSYMIRGYVLFDGDYGVKNLGIIHNTKKNEFYMSPNYDYEFIMDPLGYEIKTRECFYKDRKYLEDNYPNVYKKFIDKFSSFTKVNGSEPEFIKLIKSYRAEMLGDAYEMSRYYSYLTDIAGCLNKNFFNENYIM